MRNHARDVTLPPPPDPYDLDVILAPPKARWQPTLLVLGILTVTLATVGGVVWLSGAEQVTVHPERQVVRGSELPASASRVPPPPPADPQAEQLDALGRELTALRQEIAALAEVAPRRAAPPVVTETLPPLPAPRRTGAVVATLPEPRATQGIDGNAPQANQAVQFGLTFNALLERELARNWDVSPEDVIAELDAEPSSKGPLRFGGAATDGEATLVYAFGPKKLDKVSVSPARGDTEMALSGILGPAYLVDNVKTWSTGAATVTLTGATVTLRRDKLEEIPLVPEGS